MQNEMPIINVTASCNQRCIFCSRRETQKAYTVERIKAVISEFKDSICFEGGEPTLCPDVFKWIRYARAQGVKDIALVTNGFSLEKPEVAEKFLKAGVTIFNVSLPAHDAAIFDILTQTSGHFAEKTEALRNLIRVAGGSRVRITLVVNSMILGHLPDYARFILREFPEIFYLEINLVKYLGHCAKRPWLVPTLKAAEPWLLRSFKILSEGGMHFITDGFPLCFMKGFEEHCIDAGLMARGAEKFFMSEKAKCPPCLACSLGKICPGPRKDYSARFGWKELRPVKTSVAPILRRLKTKNWSINARPA